MVLEKVAAIERRYEELNALMADQTAATDPARLSDLAREQSEIEDVVSIYRAYRAAEAELADARSMAGDESDPELAEMAHAEVPRLEAEQAARERSFICFCAQGPLDEKNVIVEIRAGTGGDEAALFADDLFRMYARWADEHGFKTEMLSHTRRASAASRRSFSRCAGRGAYSG